ncbi:hypothetical protein RJG79_11445 [Mycoplasmatota bacterium WC44]
MKKSPVTLETFIFLGIFTVIFAAFGSIMGLSNFLNTFINTAYYLLINIVFWIMAVAVLTGAVAGLFSEFGILALMNKILSPLSKTMYKLPGVATLGAITAYFSDNPAIISMYKEKEFRKQFKNYQIPVLCNLGTSFGMGLVIAIAMISLQGRYEGNFVLATLVGIAAAIIGSVVSVRLLTRYSMKEFGIDKDPNPIKVIEDAEYMRETRKGSTFNRVLSASLDGGRNGVDIGLQIIPGVLLISSIVILLTNTMPDGGYTGAALEGVGFLPYVGQYLMFIFKPLFGFTSPEAIAFPITSLGSAGAAVGFVPLFLENGYITIKDIAVFTAIGTTWSGYLATHISMLDSLGSRSLSGKAILAHTIGGLVSGVTANYLFILVTMFL